MNDDRLTPYCPVCESFVTGLIKVFRTRTVVLRPTRITWGFEDKEPQLKRLAESSTRCQWCSILDYAWDRRASAGRRTGKINISFEFVKSQQRQGLLGDIVTLSPEVSNHRATFHPTNMNLHVMRDNNYHAFSSTNTEALLKAVDHCVKAHGVCPMFGSAESPHRLVNVLDGDYIKLEEMSGQVLRYAALSYCWGSSMTIETNKATSRNISERMRNFSLNTLSQTLHDAIKVVRTLGLQYVWIDALCIVQDSRDEWTREAAQMMNYYGNAYITIVPILSDGANTGIHVHNKPMYHQSFTGPWSYPDGRELILLAELPNSFDVISSSAWSSRGWTYQERLNSARIVFIFERHLILDCREDYWNSLNGCWTNSELEYKKGFLPISAAPEHTRHIKYRQYWPTWCDMVQEYTSRQMTQPEDQLFAFAGIMETYRRFCKHEFVAGLWRNRLPEELVSWIPIKPMLTPNFEGPSWSWLYSDWSSYEGSILLPETAIAQLVEVSITVDKIEDEDQTAAQLTITGSVLRNESLAKILRYYRNVPRSEYLHERKQSYAHLDLVYKKRYDCNCSPTSMKEDYRNLWNPAGHKYDCQAYHVVSCVRPKICALFIGTARFITNWKPELNWHFLLIQPADNTSNLESKLPKFRRVGTMHIPEGSFLYSHSSITALLGAQEEKTIVLV